MIATQLKIANRKQVFYYMRAKYLRTGEDTSKAEIAKQTGLSNPTLMKITDFLMEQGLLEAGEEIVLSVGRPSRMLKVKKDCMYAVGFLLEGVYLYMGVVDIFGTIGYRKILEVEPDAMAVAMQIKEHLVGELLRKAGVSKDKLVGIGIAMPVSYDINTKIISNGKMVNVEEEIYIGDYLREMEDIYQVPVFFENDANAECLGVNNARNLFSGGGDMMLFSVGTGIGAGIILDGKLRRGFHQRCGEIWPNILDSKGELVPENTLENQISLWNVFRKYGIEYRDGVKGISPRICDQIVEDIAKELAVAIHNANTLMDCKELVVCGQVIELLGELFLETVNRYLTEMMPQVPHPRLQVESLFSGIAGIAGQCIEYQVTKILEG